MNEIDCRNLNVMNENEEELDISSKIHERINARVCELSRKDGNGKQAPHVCCVCDHLIKARNVRAIYPKTLIKCKNLLTPHFWNDPQNEELARYYSYPENEAGWEPWMSRMLLSPRSSAYRLRNSRLGYRACGTCMAALKKCHMPRFAIANNNFTGRAPRELLDLNPVELAFLTPTKTCGYCFSWKGGKATNLKGSLAYYEVDVQSRARGVGQLSALGAKIVVLMNGKMTKTQKKKAHENSKIRVEKLMEALLWLRDNNRNWRGVDVLAWKRRFEQQKPTVVDKAHEIDDSEDAQQANIEVTEKFCVYFPDGTFNEYNGGAKDFEEFRSIVQEAGKNGYELQWQCDTERRLVSDITKDDAYLMANLLQFPYGRGGFNELRRHGEKSFIDKVDTVEFINHLSLLAQPDMHRPLHTLMLYNLSFKGIMLRGACSVVRTTNN